MRKLSDPKTVRIYHRLSGSFRTYMGVEHRSEAAKALASFFEYSLANMVELTISVTVFLWGRGSGSSAPSSLSISLSVSES